MHTHIPSAKEHTQITNQCGWRNCMNNSENMCLTLEKVQEQNEVLKTDLQESIHYFIIVHCADI